MNLISSLVTAFIFVSSLIGAGFATGKEIGVFFSNSNLFSVALTGVLIGIFSYPFIALGIKSKTDLNTALFKNHLEIGTTIIRMINFIFLGAMLGGAESITYEVLGIRYGSFIMAVVTILIYEFGMNKVKWLSAISVPIILIFFCILFTRQHGKIEGTSNYVSPLIYASLNTANAGIFSTSFSNKNTIKDAPLISFCIGVFTSILIIVAKAIIVGYESNTIPLYSVSLDTNLSIFSVIVILLSILTSCLSSLSLSTGKKELSPYFTCSLALVLSSLGFGQLIKYVYPAIGIIGFALIILAFIRLISTYLKNSKI